MKQNEQLEKERKMVSQALERSLSGLKEDPLLAKKIILLHQEQRKEEKEIPSHEPPKGV